MDNKQITKNMDKIFVRDLIAYQRASKGEREHRLVCAESSFDISKLPEGIRQEMRDFVIHRGEVLSLLSIRTELGVFNQFCRFVADSFPNMVGISEVSQEQMERCAKKWLLKNGKQIKEKRRKLCIGKEYMSDAELLRYIKKIYRFVAPEDNEFNFLADRWYLDMMPIKVRQNPTRMVRSISFEKIPQNQIRDEIKQVIYIHLEQNAVGTVLLEMTAVNRFCEYLKEKHSWVESILDVTRDVLEDYLIHTHTEANSRKSYTSDLKHLKAMFMTAAKIFETKELAYLFYADDIAKVPERVYKVYSDEEVQRLNAAIVAGDIQVARALLLHQLFGTRISETLTLRKDSVYQNSQGQWMVRIYQIKTRKWYEKPISKEARNLFEVACAYTREKYGETEYVFVAEEDAARPMTYSQVQYFLMSVIHQNDLRMDNGESFSVGTHIYRNVYGKRLTELGIDDLTIAKLLGHANTQSLYHYRKIGNEMLCDATRPVRQALDNLLKDYVKEW